jgi:hypothetical protein
LKADALYDMLDSRKNNSKPILKKTFMNANYANGKIFTGGGESKLNCTDVEGEDSFQGITFDYILQNNPSADSLQQVKPQIMESVQVQESSKNGYSTARRKGMKVVNDIINTSPDQFSNNDILKISKIHLIKPSSKREKDPSPHQIPTNQKDIINIDLKGIGQDNLHEETVDNSLNKNVSLGTNFKSN